MNAETLRKAQVLKAAAKVRIERFQFSDGHCSTIHEVVIGTKESATCKRASMDLSRALSALRKP